MRETIIFISRGGLITLAVVTILAAGELAFDPAAAENIRRVTAVLAVGVAGGLVYLQHMYFQRRDVFTAQDQEIVQARADLDAFRTQVHALDRERKNLRQEIETLAAQREMSRAATAHTTLEDLLDEMVGVVHDLAGAREISVFLTPHDALPPAPRAHYHLSQATELMLSFTDEGGRKLREDLEAKTARKQPFSAEAFAARSLSVAPKGRHIVITSALDYQNREVGTARLTLNHILPEDTPPANTLAALIATELGKISLDTPQALNAMIEDNQRHFDAKTRLVSIAQLMEIDQEPVGIVRVSFDCRDAHNATADIEERGRILAESARHIARAIRSDRIYEQAIRDSLTKLFNKRYMMTQLAGYFNTARRNRAHLSLILLDIDHFKSVNDTHGHLTGDTVLQGVSAILRDSIRSCDIACRYGGEELAVILPEGNLTGTRELAERLRRRIEAHTFTTEANTPLKITASLGVAEHHPEMIRIEDIIADADAGLYRAKEGGRNQVIVGERTPARI